MKIVFMGTGTSVGVPAIGCRCRVCRSRDPRNHRRRAALYIEADGRHLVIDTPPDFREQVLSCGVPRLDALLYTHAHSDHVCGLDDVRRFCEIQRQTIPVYAAGATLRALSRSFAYIHRTPRPGLSYPRVDFRPVERAFRIGRICVTPLPVEHAGIFTQGYRVAADGVAMAYLPDCHTLPAATMQRLQHLDVVILDALRRTAHPTHLSLDESVAIMRRLRPRRGYITHMGHDLEFTRTQRSLPSGLYVPWDGLTLRLRPVA